MSIIRVKKNKDYFAASNEPFNDTSLSWEARGMMGYLLSKPDDWELRLSDLINKGPAGAKKIRGILKELEEHGYLERYKFRGEDGRFVWVSVVYENSTILPKGICGDPTILPKSIDGKGSHLISTKLLNTNIYKRKKRTFSYDELMSEDHRKKYEAWED